VSHSIVPTSSPGGLRQEGAPPESSNPDGLDRACDGDRDWGTPNAAATVVQVTYSGRNHTWTAYYRYEVGGLPQTGSYWRRDARPKVGEAVNVNFDPGSPDRSARSREDLFGRAEALQWLLLPILAAIAWGLSTATMRRQEIRPVIRKADRGS
jgi:hypothetical protein